MKTRRLKKLNDLLDLARFRAESCDFEGARDLYLRAFKQGKKSRDWLSALDALTGLIGISIESMDQASLQLWDRELDPLLKNPCSSLAWFSKGLIALHYAQWMTAQRCFHRSLKGIQKGRDFAWLSARCWLLIAFVFLQRGRLGRSSQVATEILRKYERTNMRGIRSFACLILGGTAERSKNYALAEKWLHKAMVQYLKEHNWYASLYVSYAQARTERQQQNYPQARAYLDQIGHAVSTGGLLLLRSELEKELSRLKESSLDLQIDSQRGIVKTKDGGIFSLRKQYVLLNILEALSGAHQKHQKNGGGGLSKAEIIEYVWREPYQPHVHDSKLYYNINRLRKLIEPDIRRPRYLMNWKKGYRLAPGLKVQILEGPSPSPSQNSG